MELEHAPLPIVEYAVAVEPRKRDVTGTEVFEEGDLLVRAVVLQEQLDGLYELELTVLADAGFVEVEPEALLEADVTLRITRGDQERHVHGIVSRVVFAGVEENSAWLKLQVVPAVALLNRFRRSRIFQDQSVVDITVDLVRENLGAYDRDVDTSLLSRPHEVRDYCVQYRESDLQFIQRILAEDGIFLLFDHSDESRERIVLIDDPASFAPIGVEFLEQAKEPQEPPFVPVIADRAETADTEGVLAFKGVRAVATRSVEVRGWDWKSKPLGFPDASEMIDAEAPGWFGEAYHHSDRRLIEEERGSGPHRDEAPNLAKRRLAHLASRGTSASGRSFVTSFSVGHTFTLDGHPSRALDDGTYVLTKITHVADCPHVERGGGTDSGAGNYSNVFDCAPLEMRQVPRERSKPRIYGHQTAVVVGPKDEEIHTDALGRVKVLMHWDREQRDAAPETSCWLRVAQMWAGAGWGTFFLPRVGMEVLVSFMDGDPDRPVVTGCLYNGANGTPYTLPADRAKSTIKTRSYPGGGGFNELRFEDTKGGEEVFIHAQRDMNTRVRRNQSTTVGNNQYVTVKNDRTANISGNEQHNVGKDRVRTVQGNEEVTISGNQTILVNGAEKPGDLPDAEDSNQCAADKPEEPGIFTSVNGTITLKATTRLVLEVGPVKVELTPSAIAISAPGQIGLAIDKEGSTTNMSMEPGLIISKASHSELMLGPVAVLKSEQRVRNQCRDSHMTVDPMAVRARSEVVVVDGTESTTLQSGKSTTVSGATVAMNAKSEMSMNSGTQITATCSGSKQTFMGGMINLD